MNPIWALQPLTDKNTGLVLFMNTRTASSPMLMCCTFGTQSRNFPDVDGHGYWIGSKIAVTVRNNT
ncbi:Protein of unknown function [Pyronema omphalodes CBS 100304]|nr:Protein of unknown function [Pyronema omphalodes CBS 100304]